MTKHSGRGTAGCVDDELLAAYVDGALEAPERLQVEQHLVTCAECRDVLGGVVVETAGDWLDAQPRGRRWTPGRTGVLALAAAAVLSVAVLLPARWHDEERQRLIALVDASRPIEPRLTISRGHTALPPLTRDAGAAPARADARIALAEMQKRADADPSAANMHLLAVARLTNGDLQGAVTALEAAASRSSDEDLRVDLAAALLASGRRAGDMQRIERAQTVLRGVLEDRPDHLQALFNAALAVEYAGRRAEAVAAWERYLNRDTSSAWAEEARAHLSRLRQQ